MTADVVPREVAIAELERLCAARRLVPPEPVAMPDEVKAKAEAVGEVLPVFYPLHYERVIRAIQDGAVIVEEDGTAVIQTTHSKGVAPFKCGEPTGAMYLAQDKQQGGHHQNMAALGALCGRPLSDFGKLHPRDYEVAVALLGIFLR